MALACSRHGSRVLDAIWSGAALGARKEIAAELGEYHCPWVASRLLCLVADWFSRFQNCGLVPSSQRPASAFCRVVVQSLTPPPLSDFHALVGEVVVIPVSDQH